MPNCAFLIGGANSSTLISSIPRNLRPGAAPSPRRSHKNLNFKATCQTSLAARRVQGGEHFEWQKFSTQVMCKAARHLSAVRIGAGAARTPQWQTYQGMQKSMLSLLRPAPFAPPVCAVWLQHDMPCQAPVGMAGVDRRDKAQQLVVKRNNAWINAGLV